MSASTPNPETSFEEDQKKPIVIKRLPSVICKSGLVLFEGTLVLTSNEIRLINGKQVRERIDASYLESTDSDPGQENLPSRRSKQFQEQSTSPIISIPLSNIESMTYERAFGKPSLFLKWEDQTRSFGRARKIQFIQKGGPVAKEQRLVTWIPIIEDANHENVETAIEEGDSDEQGRIDNETAEIKIDEERLEVELLGVLDVKDWKGLFQIVKDIREKYGTDYDLDVLETLCKKLAKNHVIDEDKAGEFYRKTTIS